MNKRRLIATTLLTAAWVVCSSAPVQAASGKLDTGVGEKGVALPSSPAFKVGGEKVTMDNIVRAETAKYFAEETIKTGPNKFRHEREGIKLDHQTVIRSNFDLIYSYGVFDASKGLSVTVPAYDRYQSVQIFDENHVTLRVAYPGDTVSITKKDLTYGDHVYLFMRTQPPSTDKAGMDVLHKRQDSVKVKAGAARPYVSEVKYDVDSFNALRADLLKRGPAEAVLYKGFIEKLADIQPPHYQMVNLGGWGGLPATQTFYFVVLPGNKEAAAGQCSSTTFKAPDLQYKRSGYWSITVYDELGWVVTNPFKISSLDAKPNADGSYTLNFNCGDKAINNMKVPNNWNALFRSYLPTSLESILAFEKDFTANHKVMPTGK